jgi:hypothetical protein
VLYRRSEDGGKRWTSPVTLSEGQQSGFAADDPRLLADQSGRLFVAWSEFRAPTGWPPSGTFMTRSLDGGNTWLGPLRVVGENRALLNVAESDTGVLYRVWYSTGDIGQKGGQWSTDGGETWSRPERIAPMLKGGLTGLPPMAFDSAGVLHFAPSASGTPKDGIYHLTWDGRNWTQPTYISTGSVGKTSVELPAITISRGNQVHVVYEDDFQRLWYTTHLTAAPQTMARPVPAPPALASLPTVVPAVPTPTAAQVATPVPTRPKPPVPADTDGRRVETSSEPMRPLLATAIPVLLLLGGLIVLRLRRLV